MFYFIIKKEKKASHLDTKLKQVYLTTAYHNYENKINQ